MSFWDKVGDAWNTIKDAGATVGGAIATVNNMAENDIPVFGAALKTTENVVGTGAGALNTAYSYGVARPLSTLQQVGDKWSTFLNADDWRQAWNRSADISPGQAWVTRFEHNDLGNNTPGVGTFDMTPEAIKNRDNFFHHTWQGQISSGAIDAASNILLDPTMGAAKLAKGAAVARTTFAGADEVGNVLKVNAGTLAGAASRRQVNLSGRMDKFFGQLDNQTGSQIALHPIVKKSDQSGAFAYLFGRINQEYATDTVARRAAQRNVFGAMLGNADSIDALKQQHTLLANDLYRLSETPAPSSAVAHFSWDDNGQGVMVAANAAEAPEVTAQRTAIQRQMARLETAISATGSVNRVAGTLPERAASALQGNSLKVSFLNSGIGNRPIQVVAGALANRLPGQIAIKDPVQGFTDLENTLRQATVLNPAVRRGLLDNYVNAANDGDRLAAVRRAEMAVFNATASNHNIAPAVAKQLLEAGDGRRAAVISSLKSRLYSASADDKFISHVDPETDTISAYGRPVLQSQLEDHLPFVNPVELDKAMKAVTQNRMLERIAGQIGGAAGADGVTGVARSGAARDLATSAYDVAGSAQMLASDGLKRFTQVWKDSALMRLAYPARIQIDSQMRLLTHMGAMGYLSSVIPAMKAQRKYLLSTPEGGSLSLRNILGGPGAALKGEVLKGGNYEQALTDMLTKAGIHEDDIPNIVSAISAKDGGIADLASEMSNAQLARYRATGEWGYVDEASPGWKQAWTRAVNRQIRNSPTAMMAANGADISALREFALTNPAGRKEWANLTSSQGGDLMGWLGRVQAHVDHYLPTAEMKQATVNGAVSGKQIDKWFADVNDRMRVHGESYAPTNVTPLGAWYDKARNGWYTFAAEAPETVMARAPLYIHAFKRNLAGIVEQHGGEDAIDSATMMNIRKSADRLARREVGKVLFDTSHASNLSQSLRYVAPFFSAWEDMVKKWGGLFYDKPWATVRFDQAWNAPNQAGFVVDENGNRVDAEGNRFDPNTGRKLDPVKDKFLIGKQELIAVPAWALPKALKDAVGTGELDPATNKKRAGSVFSINKNSFNIVFQGQPWWLPSAGPVVQVPVNQLVKYEFPEAASNPIIQAALPMGVSDNSLTDQFLPSWVRQVHNAFGSTQDHANIQAMLLAQETNRWRNGERGPIKPGEISNMTRNWFIMRAITSNASPVSMQPTAKTQFYVDQAHIYRQKYGQNWQDQFYKDFPQWYDMSLSLSNNDTGIVATLNAVDAAKKYRSLIADNPEYGWLFVGPDNQYGQTPGTAFNQAAYAWEQQSIGYGQAKSFRGQSSPQDALGKVEASKGWMQYQSAMTQLNMILQQRGLHSFEQKDAADIKTAKTQIEDYLMQSNPAWRKDFLQTDSGKVVNMLDMAQKAMADNSELAKRPDMVALNQYTQARRAIQGILASRPQHSLAANQDVADAWGQITQHLIQNNIGFEQMWNRVLQKDDPSKNIPGVSSDG